MDDLWKRYPEFRRTSLADESIVEKYRHILPAQITDLWKVSGFGVWMNGYLKVVNPDLWAGILTRTYDSVDRDAVVMFATGMADLLVWQRNVVIQVNYRYGIAKVVGSEKFFFEDLADHEFLTDNLNWTPYAEACEHLGQPDEDECFGYVPILAAGGAERMANLKRVGIADHIQMIAEMAGKVSVQ